MKDNRTITKLPLLSCHFVDLPESGIDCSVSDPFSCVKCGIPGKFWAGGDMNDYGSPGHVVAIIEWILTVLIGLSGTITNSLIITIIKRQNSKRAFDTFLLALACFDLIGSVMCIVASSSTIVMFENWDRGKAAQYFVYLGTFTSYFARSGSSLLTVMITLERYLAVAFPIRSSAYFTELKTRMICIVFFLIAAFLAFPRFASFAIVENKIGYDIPSLQELDYVILATSQERFWYGTMGAVTSIIDFWVPLPLLLILNILVYIEIRKFSNKRKEMNVNFKKEINAFKMFTPVVVFLFVCNIVGYFHFYFIKAKKLVYREIFLGLFLSISLNSFVNFFFYMKSDAFRKEFENLLSECPCGEQILKRIGKTEWEATVTNEKKTHESGISTSV